MRAAIVIAVAAVALALSTVARAGSNVAALDDAHPNQVTVTTGLEYGLVLGAGYERSVTLLGRRIALAGDATLAWAEADAGDYRLRAGATAPIIGRGAWRLVGSVAPTVRGTSNATADMTGVGVDAAVLAGRYVPRWFVALELGFDWAIATRIVHSDAYRMSVYEDARDGWYGDPGGNLRYGMQGGVSVGRYGVILRAGTMRDTSGRPPLLPFYATLAVDARF